jgi:hypothetical protein
MIVAEIGAAGTLADGSSRSRPDARDGRDREVECGRPPTGGPVLSDRKEQTFFPSLRLSGSSLLKSESFHYGKNDTDSQAVQGYRIPLSL